MGKLSRRQVVVITGASSGIGRATALEFAKQRARLVLGARSRENLERTAEKCRKSGADVLVVPTDVSREEDVQNLAEQAVERFGQIDVWINDAGVGLYSRFEQAPPDEYRQVIETNLFGAIYGARAAVAEFRRANSGLLVNISSQLAFGGAPYSSAYAISKYGMRALSDTLRQELLGTGIRVCTVYPASTDTPFFQHAANYTGKEVQPLGSVSDPRDVAKAIVQLVKRPKPEVLIGKSGYVIEPLHWFATGAHARLLRKKTDRDHFQEKFAPPRQGNLFAPARFASEKGGWKRSRLPGALFGFAGLVGGALALRRLASARPAPEDVERAA
jgi:NAD(P)-dependent dehydrogenase (short-subunit alcohol dehydrogenase family)